jgi:hypothetical protein
VIERTRYGLVVRPTVYAPEFPHARGYTGSDVYEKTPGQPVHRYAIFGERTLPAVFVRPGQRITITATDFYTDIHPAHPDPKKNAPPEADIEIDPVTGAHVVFKKPKEEPEPLPTPDVGSSVESRGAHATVMRPRPNRLSLSVESAELAV